MAVCSAARAILPEAAPAGADPAKTAPPKPTATKVVPS